MNVSMMNVKNAVGLRIWIAEMIPQVMLYAWRDGYDGLMFSPIWQFDSPTQGKKWFEYHYLYPGKTAIVYVFTNDYDIMNVECLLIAKNFMRGDFVVTTIDLCRLTRKVEKGRPYFETNPR